MANKKDSVKPKRWDLAKGGINIAMPFGVKVEPWPRWLSKTFVNIHLLNEEPFELRQDLFGGGRHPDNIWGIVDTLLYTIEDEAKKVLKKQPLPFFNLENDSEDWEIFRDLSEHEFYEIFAYSKDLSDKQKNAVVVLRSIQVIRSNTHTINNQGYRMCDPDHDNVYESLTVARLIMEIATLMVAAIRGELWEEHWPYIDKMRGGPRNPRPNRRKVRRTETLTEAMESLGIDKTPRTLWVALKNLGASSAIDSKKSRTQKEELIWTNRVGESEVISFEQFKAKHYKLRNKRKKIPSPK